MYVKLTFVSFFSVFFLLFCTFPLQTVELPRPAVHQQRRLCENLKAQRIEGRGEGAGDATAALLKRENTESM